MPDILINIESSDYRTLKRLAGDDSGSGMSSFVKEIVKTFIKNNEYLLGPKKKYEKQEYTISYIQGLVNTYDE